VVCNYSTGNDSDPYHKPFDLDHPVMSPWTLVVERQHWRDVAPGLSTCVQLSATQAYYDEQIGNYNVNASEDDAYGTPAPAFVLNGNLRIGNDGAGNVYSMGVRFTNVVVPQYAYIIRAYITVRADANLAANTCSALMSCENADDPAVFSTWANFAGRVRAGSYGWSLPAFVNGTDYDSGSFAGSLQTVVNRAGWSSGNHVVVFMDDNASTAGAYRTMFSWDSGHAPILYVWWFDAVTRTFGRTATCNNEVYVSNKHNLAQLTHAFHYDNSTGIYSANLIGAALPVAFLPAVPAANDAVYFGITDAHPTMYGPFNSVVFDIGTAQAQITTIVWEYYDGVGAAWAAIASYRDNTNADGAETGDPFDTTGVNSFHFKPIDAVGSRWGLFAINGVSAYWIRARVTVVGGAPTPPTQQNRDFYTVVTPYVDTLAAQVPGDITALAELIAEGQSGQDHTIAGQTVVYAGLRIYDKGSEFSAYINLSDVQNALTIPVTVNGGTCVFGNDREAATGRIANVAHAGAAVEAWACYATIPSSLADDYTGSFRCFLRGRATFGAPWDLRMRLKICSGTYTNVVNQTRPVAPISGGGTVIELLDFGKITLPGLASDTGEVYKNIILRIDSQAIAAGSIRLFDIILIPADECFLESRAISPPDSAAVGAIDNQTKLRYDSTTGEWRKLKMDSLIPRRMIKTDIIQQAGTMLAAWDAKITGSLMWQPNERQRWWFLQSDVNPGYQSLMHDVLSVQGWKVSRYLSMRGAR
jgi:hypothetical protein